MVAVAEHSSANVHTLLWAYFVVGVVCSVGGDSKQSADGALELVAFSAAR